MSEPAHCQLPLWLDPRRRENAPVDLGMLKGELARQGINSRGWRLYLDYGDALFSPLGRPWIHPDQPFTSGPNAVAYLRLLQACEMDVLPPPDLVGSLLRWGLPNERLDQLPFLFFRAAWKAAVANLYELRDPATFILQEVLPVASWFFASGIYESANPGLLKAGWPALLRRQKAWALEQAPAALARTVLASDEWNPYIRRVEWGLYRFEALTNVAQLLEEGAAMQHCVGTYPDYCRCGVRRIYSVRERKSGRRVATFSVQYVHCGDGTLAWQCDQLSGPKNADVLQRDIIVAADAVLRAYCDLPGHTFTRPALPVRTANAIDQEEWCCDF